jgi:cytoskeletal protein RodZ
VGYNIEMKTVGEILKESREAQGLTLDDVSKRTKIKRSYIESIEAGEYEGLPDDVYVQGFIRSYASCLGIGSEKLLPFYRREQTKHRAGSEKKKNNFWQKKNKIQITPLKLLSILTACILTGFILFLFLQYRMFSSAPVLIVDAPFDQVTTSTDMITIIGKTDSTATLTINGTQINVGSEGEFQHSFSLEEGINRIRIVATNSLGKKSVVERVIEKTNTDQ